MRSKDKTKAKELVYLYLFLIRFFMCLPIFIHFILSFFRAIKVRRRSDSDNKKSIRELHDGGRITQNSPISCEQHIKELSVRVIHIFRRHKITWHVNVSRCYWTPFICKRQNIRTMLPDPHKQVQTVQQSYSSIVRREKVIPATAYMSPYTQLSSRE